MTGGAGFCFHFMLMLIMIETDVSFRCFKNKIPLFGCRVSADYIVVIGSQWGCAAKGYKEHNEVITVVHAKLRNGYDTASGD